MGLKYRRVFSNPQRSSLFIAPEHRRPLQTAGYLCAMTTAASAPSAAASLASRPIGMFDSGIGGLTVARAVARLLPQERIVYFGDTAHLPYGQKHGCYSGLRGENMRFAA